MTERLYYTDSGLLDFEGTIVSSLSSGDLYYTVLDRTAFYPTSGGQLHDTGVLGDIEVTDVVEGEQGEIQHVTARPVGEKGATVTGRVDKARRMRHRQQHTAQHILSQIFHRQYGLVTMSVHLGEDYGAIELNTEELTQQDLDVVEKMATEVIFDNVPVEILMVDGSDIESIPLRKPPKRSGLIRVIKIGEFEYSACGGTHCASTAEVGVIKIIATEKIRSRVLIKFLAGVQAVNDYRLRFEVTDLLSRSQTCHISDLPARFEKLEAENRELRMEAAKLQREMLPARAGELAKSANAIEGTNFVFDAVEGYDAKLLGKLGSEVANLIDGVSVLCLDGRLVISTAEASGRNAAAMAAELIRSLNLKGGGSPRQAHLGGIDMSRLDEYRNCIEGLL